MDAHPRSLAGHRREGAGSTARARRAAFEIPPRWRDRVALRPSLVLARGTVVVVSDVAAYADVDRTLFVPVVEGDSH
jgi:hypothetical protein